MSGERSAGSGRSGGAGRAGGSGGSGSSGGSDRSGGSGGFDDLYGEMILDHNRHPRNFGRLAGANHMAVGHNPLCGDRVAVYLRLEADRIAEIAFDGAGCAISTASASMMTEALRGKSLAEAEDLFQQFHAMLTGKVAGGEPGRAGSAADAQDGGDGEGVGGDSGEQGPELGKLVAFSGVNQFPMRVKCATLAWHALQSAIAAPVSGGAASDSGAAPKVPH